MQIKHPIYCTIVLTLHFNVGCVHPWLSTNIVTSIVTFYNVKLELEVKWLNISLIFFPQWLKSDGWFVPPSPFLPYQFVLSPECWGKSSILKSLWRIFVPWKDIVVPVARNQDRERITLNLLTSCRSRNTSAFRNYFGEKWNEEWVGYLCGYLCRYLCWILLILVISFLYFTVTQFQCVGNAWGLR